MRASISPSPDAPGGPFACQRDIACPEGAPYQDVKRAVAAEADRALQLGTTTLQRAEQTRLAAEQAAEAAKQLQKKTAEGRAATRIFLWVMGFAGLFSSTA